MEENTQTKPPSKRQNKTITPKKPNNTKKKNKT